MRILVAGASGFIGRAVADALARDGHEVIGASRQGQVAVDFSKSPDAQWWVPRLQGIDAVVNAVGILRETADQRFDELHTRAPAALFRACEQAGVRYVVQVSALGADASHSTRYFATKHAADEVLRSLRVDAAVVQPSLVYGSQGASALLFDALAASPVLMLPAGGRMLLQPVDIDDVADGITAILRERATGIHTIAFVGPQAITMREYLARSRRALGIAGRAIVLPFPAAVFRAFAAFAARVPGSSLDRDTARMLLAGNSADAGPFTRLLGRPPKSIEEFVPNGETALLRTRALIAVWSPVLRIALAAMWIWTGIVSLGLYPVEDSLALLARVGLDATLARVALYAAALLDLLLGLATLVLPRARRRALWIAQLLLIAGYTILITVFLPEYWLHPYGPISKNLPILAAIAMLAALDRKEAR